MSQPENICVINYKSYVNVYSTPDGKYEEVANIDIKTGKTIPHWEASGDKLASYSFMQWRNRRLLGKILTIIDASIADVKQNKAVKDLIKNNFFQEYEEVCDYLIDTSKLNPQVESLDEVQEISQDEALGLK